MTPRLSDSLEQTLRLIIQGKTHEEIARELVVEITTVNKYVERLKQKFADEPEFQERKVYSRRKALILVGQRYFNKFNVTTFLELPAEYKISEHFHDSSEDSKMSAMTI